MITNSLKSPKPGFQFGGHVSVTFNGDVATLYVGRLDNNGEAATPRLQVWALASAPAGEQISGVLLAEAETQTLYGGYYLEYITLDAELADSVRGLQTIVVTVSRAGATGWWDDLALMPDLINFYHPQLVQPAAARLTADGFTASVAGVSNPRAEGAISGSLVIEFWALADQGGFTGHDFHLGGVEYLRTAGGEMTGAVEFSGRCHYPAGEYYPALVLREWSGSSYLVRDRIVGASPVQLPPSLDAVADAFSAQAPQAVASAPSQPSPAQAETANPVEVKAEQAAEALKDGPRHVETIRLAKKVVIRPEDLPAKPPPATKTPKKVVKTVESKKVATKKAAKQAGRKPAKKTAAKATKKAAKAAKKSKR